MKRILLSVGAFFILNSLVSAASFPLPPSSTNQATGKIMGVLLDVNDARIVHAKIKIESKDFKWEGESDEAGEFTVDVPAGTYLIYADANGFRKFESPFLKVKPAITEMVNLHLEVKVFIDQVDVGTKKPPEKN
jgi:hypothetical protein